MNDLELLEMASLQKYMELSVSQYKRWLGLYVRSLNGNLPGVAEWKVIKHTLDKVKDHPTPHFIDPSWINPIYRR